MFFDRLQQACDNADMSMSVLLDRLEMSRGSITRWKNGTMPNASTVAKLAEALGVSQSYLLGESDDPGHRNTPDIGDDAGASLSSTEIQIMRIMRNLPSVEKDRALAWLEAYVATLGK